ncbi:MAG: 4-hydroxybenzoate octaprenyltransferase [Gemmatales bacterium]|nr:MAG: 4-hydroxybenzoate octaprenyltransferase [Gemmatales bacterium]
MLAKLRSLLEMIRFSHTLFALPFAFLSAVLAWQIEPFRWLDFVGIVLCMTFARSTAMAFNRIVDREFDAANPRTANRHLPAGLISVRTAWFFVAICAAGFIVSTLLFRNPWPMYLSVPVLLFICCYSLTKRFTSFTHFWLGASLLLAPVSTWIAIIGMQQLALPFVLGLAVLAWVAGFDILYACQDVDFDRQVRLNSLPAALGVRKALRIALLCHAAMVALLILFYFVAGAYLGTVYLMGVAAVAGLLAYEHSLVRPDDLSRVNQAFFNVNVVISVGLFLLVLLQLAVNNM